MEPQSIFGRRPAEGSYRITPREKKEWMKMSFLSENFLNSPLGANERFQWESTQQGNLDDIDDMMGDMGDIGDRGEMDDMVT